MSEQEKEPLMITPGGGAFPFAVVGEIEQAEQEPVAWMDCYGEVRNDRELSDLKTAGSYTKASTYDRPLFAAPVRTKDLTDDELRQVLDRNCGDGLMAIARAVIAADREKNK